MMSGSSLGHNIGGREEREGRFKKIQNHNDLEIPFLDGRRRDCRLRSELNLFRKH